jgi:hypothetical protein
MDPVLKKLQVRGNDRLLVLGAPPELAGLITSWTQDVPIGTRTRATETAALVFVRSRADVEGRAPKVVAALEANPLLWFAYPKKSSKRYACDISRDDGWATLGALGFEPVRQVALDQDWSALRFRRAEDIGQLTRDRAQALSEVGRERATGGTGTGPSE